MSSSSSNNSSGGLMLPRNDDDNDNNERELKADSWSSCELLNKFKSERWTWKGEFSLFVAIAQQMNIYGSIIKMGPLF